MIWRFVGTQRTEAEAKAMAKRLEEQGTEIPGMILKAKVELVAGGYALVSIGYEKVSENG